MGSEMCIRDSSGITAYLSSLTAFSLLNDQPEPAHFQIDVTLLSGQFKLSNGRFAAGYTPGTVCNAENSNGSDESGCYEEIPVGGATTYSFDTDHSPLYKLPQIDEEKQLPDFNFDGEIDYIALLDENASDQESNPMAYGLILVMMSHKMAVYP